MSEGRHILVRTRLKELSAFKAVRAILAFVLFLAATLKGHQLATEPVVVQGALDSRWARVALVEFEALFALWFVSGRHPLATWRIALSCFTAFGVVALAKTVAGEASCGCFGNVMITPWVAFLVDIVAIVLLSATRPGPPYVPSAPLFSTVELITLSALIGVPSAALMGSYSAAKVGFNGAILGDGNVVVLEPHEWVGRQWPLLRHVDIGSELADGEWTVVLFRHDCSKCGKLLDEYIQGASTADGKTERIAFIEVPPIGSDVSSFEKVGLTYGQLATSYDWFVSTPVVMSVTNGKIVSCKNADVASSLQLE